MGDKTGALIAAAITLPLAFLLIYAAFCNLVARLRDVGDAIERERPKHFNKRQR